MSTVDMCWVPFMCILKSFDSLDQGMRQELLSSPFNRGETEAQRGEVICPRSHSQQVEDLGFKPRHSDSGGELSSSPLCRLSCFYGEISLFCRKGVDCVFWGQMSRVRFLLGDCSSHVTSLSLPDLVLNGEEVRLPLPCLPLRRWVVLRLYWAGENAQEL